MLGFDGLPVGPRKVIVIRQGRTTGPAAKKRQGTLGCEKTIRIADLPDLGAAAFIRGWLKPAQPVQKAVVAQRLQGANYSVPRPLQLVHDPVKGRVQAAGLEADQIAEQRQDLQGDAAQGSVASPGLAAVQLVSLRGLDDLLHLLPRDAAPERAFAGSRPVGGAVQARPALGARAGASRGQNA